MRALTDDEFLATMDEPRPIDLASQAPCDFWSYIDAMPPTLEGYRVDREVVSASYIMRSGTWQHVHLATDTPNVYVVLVIDVPAQAVAGHHLLNLNKLYGIEVEH